MGAESGGTKIESSRFKIGFCEGPRLWGRSGDACRKITHLQEKRWGQFLERGLRHRESAQVRE